MDINNMSSDNGNVGENAVVEILVKDHGTAEDHSVQEPAEFSYRDNYLDFIFKYNNPSTNTKVRFFADNKGDYGCYTITDYCVSDGQDPDRCIRDDDYFLVNNRLYFRCGRHKTEKVAKWWNREYPGEYNTFHKNFDDMNFAMKGNLRLNLTGEALNGERAFVVLEDIGIAQTSSNGRNVWVIGKKIKHCDGSRIVYNAPYIIANTNDPTSDNVVKTNEWLRIYLYRNGDKNGVNEVSVDAQIAPSPGE